KRRGIEQKAAIDLALDEQKARGEAKREDQEFFAHRKALRDVPIDEERARLRDIAGGGMPGFSLAERRAAGASEFDLARNQDEALFQLRRALGETTLQSELSRIDTLIAREREGTAERIKLETERAAKVTQIREAEQQAALGLLGIGAAALQKKGQTEATQGD